MTRPTPSEYAPFYEKYVALVPESDSFLDLFEAQTAATLAALGEVGEDKSLHRYAPGKWSIRESFVHVADTERIFTYRALRFARGDGRELTGFDQDEYILPSEADRRTWSSIVNEYAAVRQATLALFRNLPADAWTRTGTANNHGVSVRALAYITAGHELHHMALLRERYLQP
jgi:uncharacterized damage-inducible protein DinB